MATRGTVALGAGVCASLAALVASGLGLVPGEIGGFLEVLGVVTGIWSVWLLARNNPLGWWVGLVTVSAYMVVFYRVQLYAEVGIQVFYFVTSVQAILIWLRGGTGRTERPVSRVPPRWILATLVLLVVAVVGLRWLLVEMRGAAPFWDALTTVLSLAAHVWLMGRFVESWYLWIAVDVIYVPLYASRGLYLTSGLYACFLLLAIRGCLHFRRLHAERVAAGEVAA